MRDSIWKNKFLDCSRKVGDFGDLGKYDIVVQKQEEKFTLEN